MPSDRLAAITEQALAISAKAPPTLQEAVFNRAFDALWAAEAEPNGHKSGGSSRTTSRTTRPAPSGKGTSDSDVATKLMSALRSPDHPDIEKLPNAKLRSLYILKVAKDEHGIDGLTPPAIATILTDKFRIRTTPAAVGMALKDERTTVDREKAAGGAFMYRIMSAGEEILSTALSKAQAAPPIATKKAPKSKSPLTTSTTGKSPGKSVSRSKIGPKLAIRQMIEAGEFGQAETVESIRSHLSTNYGRSFDAKHIANGLLRLLRDGAVGRKRNDDGVYQYSPKTQRAEG